MLKKKKKKETPVKTKKKAAVKKAVKKMKRKTVKKVKKRPAKTTAKTAGKKTAKKALKKTVKKPKTILKQKPQKAKKTNLGLSKAREETLRRILLDKKQEVWRDVKERLFTRMGKEYREETDVTLDDGDKAMVDLAAETGLSLIDIGTDVLEKIDRALAKLDEGTYGICEDCGAEIHENRLKVVPFAIYCINCKSRREEMESIAREPDRFATPEHEEIVD